MRLFQNKKAWRIVKFGQDINKDELPTGKVSQDQLGKITRKNKTILCFRHMNLDPE